MSSLELDQQAGLDVYRAMFEMRVFEDKAYSLFLEGLVKGTTHLGQGQEAVAVGFGAAMRSDDLSFSTYRGHNHTLARGAPMAAVMAELLGYSNGICGGKGGSMHITSAPDGHFGSYAIVGAHMPIAAGAAWAAAARGSGQVAVCFFGDGATNIGAFHEALNMATVWDLPVVFVCENNLYMEYTPIELVTAVEHPAADRAAAYGLERIIIDGNDVEEVYATARETIGKARRGEGPSLVEALTYRHGGHSRADAGKYRPDEEVESWKARDPLVLFRQRLEERGIAPEEVDRLEAEATAAVDRATEEARSGSPPGEAALASELWAEGGSSWRN